MNVIRTIDKQGYSTLCLKIEAKNINSIEITDNCFTRGSIGLIFYDRGIAKRYEINKEEINTLSVLLTEIIRG